MRMDFIDEVTGFGSVAVRPENPFSAFSIVS